MANEDLINQKIREQDDHTLSTLFTPNHLIHLIDPSVLIPPFDTLLFLQKQDTHTFAHHKEQIECARTLGDNYVFVKRRVIGNIRFCRENVECVKYLLVLFNKNVCQAVVGNLILLFYMRMRSFKMMSNLVAVIDERGILRRSDDGTARTSTKRGARSGTDPVQVPYDVSTMVTFKDTLIFSAFKATVLFKTYKFSESEKYLKMLLNYRSIQRNKSVYSQLKCMLCVTLFVKDRNVCCDDHEINTLMCMVRKCRLRDIARSNDRIVGTYFYFLTVRNLIRFCYREYGSHHKLEMGWLRSAFVLNGVAEDECIFLIMQTICKGYVKGYVSVSRDVVVFSKVDPFPHVVV